jgi:hypothetical protein
VVVKVRVGVRPDDDRGETELAGRALAVRVVAGAQLPRGVRRGGVVDALPEARSNDRGGYCVSQHCTTTPPTATCED